MKEKETETPAPPAELPAGFLPHGRRVKVQTYLPRDVAQRLADEMDQTGEKAGSIVSRIVTQAVRRRSVLESF